MRREKYSIVIPVYNEEKNLPTLHSSLKSTLSMMGGRYEIIFIDDGSSDNTFSELTQLAHKDKKIKLIRLRRRFGQSIALAAGFDHASGEIVISMDGDLQNDPSDIPILIQKLDEGYDVVCGWRRDRKDPFIIKKVPSYISNWLASRLYRIKIHDFGSTLRAYRKEVIKKTLIYGELHRYFPAIIASKGFRVGEIPVTHNPRRFGESKYGTKRLIKGILDLLSLYIIEKYFTRPMHLFGVLGGISIFFGIILGIYLSALRLLYHISIADRPLLLLAVLLIIFGTQFLVLGFIGEMLARLRIESKKNALYDITDVQNLEHVR